MDLGEKYTVLARSRGGTAEVLGPFDTEREARDYLGRVAKGGGTVYEIVLMYLPVVSKEVRSDGNEA